MKKMKIYYTSDVHGYIYPHKGEGCLLQCVDDFETDGNTLVIDGGDSTQGSPFAKYLDHSDLLGVAMGAIYDRAGYQYFTLGNHDFDGGFLVMKAFLEGMGPKCLCANVIDRTGTLPIVPYEMRILSNGLKVGITGVVTDFVNHWHSEDVLAPLMVMDTFFALQQMNAFLKGRCDVMVCIYHGGFEEDLDTGKVLFTSKEHIACKICKELDFDVLLTGHQHKAVDGQLYHGTYVVQPPPNGKAFAEIFVEHDDDGVRCSGGLRKPSDGISEELLDAAMPIYDRAEEWLSGWVCTMDFPMETGDRIAQALEGSPFADVVNHAQLLATGADISVTSLPNRSLSLPRGVSIRDLMTVFPYANRLVVLEVTGQVILQALRRASSYFRWTSKGIVVDPRFLEPKEEHHSYDFFANVSYSIQLSRTGENLVSKVKVCGKPLVVERVYRIAMSDYRASGMGGYEAYRDCPMVNVLEDDIQDMMLAFFRRGDLSSVPVYQDITILGDEPALKALFPPKEDKK